MDKHGLSSEQASSEIARLIDEFSENIKAGTSDPDHFISFAEIENLWGKLIGDTNVLYSDLLENLISNIDEQDLVRKKKENIDKKESTCEQIAEPSEK